MGHRFLSKYEPDKIIDMLKPAYINGLTVLGGEPFEPANQKELLPFLKKVKERFPKKNIWVWSGNTIEWLKSQEGEYGDDIKSPLDMCEYLVDGPYVDNRRNISLKFRGSDNQRIIDLKDVEGCSKSDR